MNDDLAIIRSVPRDTLMEKQVKKFKIETPIGGIESDSGNHLVDIASVFIGIVVLYFIFGRKRNG